MSPVKVVGGKKITQKTVADKKGNLKKKASPVKRAQAKKTPVKKQGTRTTPVKKQGTRTTPVKKQQGTRTTRSSETVHLKTIDEETEWLSDNSIKSATTFSSADFNTWDTDDERFKEIDNTTCAQVIQDTCSIGVFLTGTCKELFGLIKCLVSNTGYVRTTNIYDHMKDSARKSDEFRNLAVQRGLNMKSVVAQAAAFVDVRCYRVLQPKHRQMHRNLGIDFVLNCYFESIEMPKLK